VNEERILRINGDDQRVEYGDGTRLLIGDTSAGQTSDGYHTFDELYRHRALLTAAFFQQLAKVGGYGVHKSPYHSDGSHIDGYFIVVAQLPTGQISYHYPNDDWIRFQIPERFKANEYDGHTPADVLDRLEQFLFINHA